MSTGDIMLEGGGEPCDGLAFRPGGSSDTPRQLHAKETVWAFGSCAPFTSLFAAIAVVGAKRLQTHCVVVGRKDQKTSDFL